MTPAHPQSLPQAIVTARISEPAAEGAEDHHPRASAELTVRGTGLVKPDNCPSCVCGEADCPTECCGTQVSAMETFVSLAPAREHDTSSFSFAFRLQEIVAARLAAESADLESRAHLESTGVAVRGEKNIDEIKGGAALDDCAGCTCGETGCPTECCGQQVSVTVLHYDGEQQLISLPVLAIRRSSPNASPVKQSRLTSRGAASRRDNEGAKML